MSAASDILRRSWLPEDVQARQRRVALPSREDVLALPPIRPQLVLSAAQARSTPDFGVHTEPPAPIRHQHGTTTLAFIYSGGILVAVDSRSTMGPQVSSGTVEKVIPITNHILGTMAGGAADCEFWERDLGRRVRLYEVENRERMPVSSASQLLSSTLYHYKGMDLSVGTMVSGFDADGTPHIFYCDNEGNRVDGVLFSVGSGSTFAHGILENEYRYDLTEDQAIALGRKAIYHATHRDAASGGMINVFLIKPEGWTKLQPVDNYQMYRAEHGLATEESRLPRAVE